MKSKILTLIIGILIGAIIATGGMYAYININYGTPDTVDENSSDGFQGGNGEAPEMQSGEDGEMPEKPDGDGEMPSDMPNGGDEQSSEQSDGDGDESSEDTSEQ